MNRTLTYESLEKLEVRRPVNRVDFISDMCRGKSVLDIGCLDETALAKRDTEHWLHGRIAGVATRVVGVDISEQLPDEGLETGPVSKIFRGDGVNLGAEVMSRGPFDIVVAGEFIEHVDSPLQFLRNLRERLPGKEYVFSTPNGPSFANTLLGLTGREVQHRDHLANFSFKILNTLCRRAQLSSWKIQPYAFYATEMIMNSRGPKRGAAKFTQGSIRVVENLFPLLSFGYVVNGWL